jgi:hypothetical protein
MEGQSRGGSLPGDICSTPSKYAQCGGQPRHRQHGRGSNGLWARWESGVSWRRMGAPAAISGPWSQSLDGIYRRRPSCVPLFPPPDRRIRAQKGGYGSQVIAVPASKSQICLRAGFSPKKDKKQRGAELGIVSTSVGGYWHAVCDSGDEFSYAGL